MQFSTHIKRIGESVRFALEQPKLALLGGIFQNLAASRDLLKTKDFDYWIRQITETVPEEIPTTFHGVTEARRIWLSPPATRSALKSSLLSTCESVLTYWADDDICPAQSEYHYYFHIPTNTIFKESGLGFSPDKPLISNSLLETRIARLSELAIPRLELYAGDNRTMEANGE